MCSIQSHISPLKRVYKVDEIANILNIGLNQAYQLMKKKHCSSVRIGVAIRISKASFDDWLGEVTSYK